MSKKVPSTPAEWLTFLGDIACQHPLVVLTEAGAIFERHCTELLRDAGERQTDLLDLQADLLTILPRLLNSITRAGHGGSPCVSCASKDAASLYGATIRDMNDLVTVKDTGGIH